MSTVGFLNESHFLKTFPLAIEVNFSLAVNVTQFGRLHVYKAQILILIK